MLENMALITSNFVYEWKPTPYILVQLSSHVNHHDNRERWEGKVWTQTYLSDIWKYHAGVENVPSREAALEGLEKFLDEICPGLMDSIGQPKSAFERLTEEEIC